MVKVLVENFHDLAESYQWTGTRQNITEQTQKLEKRCKLLGIDWYKTSL